MLVEEEQVDAKMSLVSRCFSSKVNNSLNESVMLQSRSFIIGQRVFLDLDGQPEDFEEIRRNAPQ